MNKMLALNSVFPADVLAAAGFMHLYTEYEFEYLYKVCVYRGLTLATQLSQFRAELRGSMYPSPEEYASFRFQCLRRVVNGKSAVLLYENDKIDATGSLVINEDNSAYIRLRSGQTFISLDTRVVGGSTDGLAATAAEVAKRVVYQLELLYDERCLRQIRRVLPISGVKIDWDAL